MLNTIYDLLDNQFTETKKLRENLEKSEKEINSGYKGKMRMNKLIEVRKDHYEKVNTLAEDTRTKVTSLLDSAESTLKDVVTATPGADFASDVLVIKTLVSQSMPDQNKKAYLEKYKDNYSATQMLNNLLYDKEITQSPLDEIKVLTVDILAFIENCKKPEKEMECAIFLDKRGVILAQLTELDELLNTYK